MLSTTRSLIYHLYGLLHIPQSPVFNLYAPSLNPYLQSSIPIYSPQSSSPTLNLQSLVHRVHSMYSSLLHLHFVPSILNLQSVISLVYYIICRHQFSISSLSFCYPQSAALNTQSIIHLSQSCIHNMCPVLYIP